MRICQNCKTEVKNDWATKCPHCQKSVQIGNRQVAIVWIVLLFLLLLGLTIFHLISPYVLFVIFLLLLLGAFPLLLLGMVKPGTMKLLFKNSPTRKKIIVAFVIAVVVSFIGMTSVVAADQKDFSTQSITTSITPTPTKSVAKVQPKPTVNAVASQVEKTAPMAPTSGWNTYIDSSYDYSIKYPKNMYIETIQRDTGGRSDRVDFRFSSNSLSTDDDKEAFTISGVSDSSFGDFDRSPKNCKEDGNCSYSKITNANKILFGCYNVGNADSDLWIQESNSYICRYTTINQDLLIWLNKSIDKKTIENILNSFTLVSSPESASAISQDVNTYGIKTNELNNQAVAQMDIMTKDIAAIQTAKYSQVQSLIPQVKVDLNTAQTTFQQIYDTLNTMYVPYDMEGSYAHYKKAIYVWIQATKAITKGVNDNNINEIESTQDIIQKADAEVNKATDQVNNYKTNS